MLHPSPSPDEGQPTLRALRIAGRPDTLTAQRVEVAIVLHAMLGESAASDYLQQQRVPAHVVARILHAGGRRRGRHDAHGVRVEPA